MAKEKPVPEVKKKPEVKVEKPKKEKTKVKFPKGRLLGGLLFIVVALVDYFGWGGLGIPRIVIDVLLLLSGLWLIKVGMGTAYSKRRRELLKKYI